MYVLDKDLQVNNIFHKWRERARVGIYLGKSAHHSQHVALVLDRHTGLVSPQFHVKFDNCFHTVKQDDLGSTWQQKAGLIKVTETQRQPQREATLLPPRSKSIPKRKKDTELQKSPSDTEEEPSATANKQSHTKRRKYSTNASNEVDALLQHANPEMVLQTGTKDLATSLDQSLPSTKAQDSVEMSEPDLASNQRKSGLPSHPKVRMIEAMMAEMSANTKGSIEGELFCLRSLYSSDDSDNDDPFYTFKAYKATTDPDTMYLHEAMKQPDKKKFSRL